MRVRGWGSEAGSAARRPASSSSSVPVGHGVLLSPRLLMSGRPLPFRSRAASRSLSRARCSRMLAAFGLIARTSAISAGLSCSHAHRRSSSASSGRSARQRLVEVRRPARAGACRRVRRRLRRAGRPRRSGRRAAAAAARRAGCWPGSSPRDAVGPGQRLGGHLVQPAPADQQGLGEHVVGGGRVGTPGQEPAQRLDQPGATCSKRARRVCASTAPASHTPARALGTCNTPTRRLVTATTRPALVRPGDGSGSSRARPAGAPGSTAGSSAGRG